MAGNKPFRKLQTSNKELNLLQDHIKASFDPLTSQPPYKLLKSVALAAGNNTISHGLGRNFLSWFAGRFSAATTLTDVASPDASNFIVISATAPATVDLLVY